MDNCNCKQRLEEATTGILSINDAHFAGCSELLAKINETCHSSSSSSDS